MNKKLAKASAAGVAAIAMAVGGSTFAAWSDFGVESTGAGAGILKLNVSDRDGSTRGIEPFSLAPGQNKYQEFFLASADADNVPKATLTAGIQNLKDIEDGGPGCTTNSEAVAEKPANVGPNGLPLNPLNDCGTTGELSDQADVQVLVSDPVASIADCPNTGIYHSATPSTVGSTLADLAGGTTFQITNDLDAGEGVCVRMEMSMPTSADNSAQGDDVSFDWRFDLTQN